MSGETLTRPDEDMPQAGGMGDDQAAAWAALQAGAAEQDAAALQGEPAGPDPAEEWAQIPALLGGVLGMAIPELKAAYTEDACRAWGAAMVPVAEKYGWDSGDLLGRWGPEIGLICATLPLGLATVAALKARRAAVEAERRAEDRPRQALAAVPAGDGAPAVKSGQGVTFGGAGAAA